jgi:cation-transporting P-type ATPase 13A2
MVFAPADWLKKLMQLTKTSRSFQVFIVCLGVVYVVVGWIFERYISGRMVGAIGSLKQRMNGKAKKRKAYKVILEDIRMQA